MTLPLLVRRSLRQHALATVVTALSIALAGALLMTVWSLKLQSQAAFTGMTGGWDAVLGARGARLQIVLNSIFHLEASPGNIPMADVEALSSNRAVALVVPIAVGDNYRGWRLVGTTPGMFEKAEYSPGKRLSVEPGGRIFTTSQHEAVVGAFAARQLGMKIGDTFHPYHGLIFNETEQHAETYTVTGILSPSSTPADRVIWIPLAGLQSMSGHIASAANDVSAALVKLRSPTAGMMLDLLYNRQGNRFTFAWPIGAVLKDLFDKLGWFDKVLSLVAVMVALVASASVLASLYNSMSARRRDLAILRALGARRSTIFAAIMLEAAAVAALGMLIAFVFHFALLSVAASVVRTQTGVVIEVWKPDWVWLWAPAALIFLGALAGIIPAIKAYRTDVAGSLSPES